MPQNILTKPSPAPKGGRINYREMMHFLEEKHGFKADDFYNARGQYKPWCEKHGLNPNDSDIEQHQRNFQAYSEAPDGAAIEPPYANFWHWVMDFQRGDKNAYSRFTTLTLNIPKILATYDNENFARQEAENKKREAAVELLSLMMPPHLQQMAKQQNKPSPAGLQPFAKTILGYIQEDFGDVVKLSFK